MRCVTGGRYQPSREMLGSCCAARATADPLLPTARQRWRRSARPADLVLLDVDAAGVDGIRGLAAACRAESGVPIVI